MNSDFVIDLWGSIRELLPAKDRQQIADILVSVCDEYGFADGLSVSVSELDGELKAAVQSRMGDAYDYDYDHDDDRESDWDSDYYPEEH